MRVSMSAVGGPKRHGHVVALLAMLLAWAALFHQAAIAWGENAPEVTPACQMYCDEPSPSEDTSAATDSSAGSSGGSYEVNYDSPAYHFGQRIRQVLGLPSMYDFQESAPAATAQEQQRWQAALDANQRGLDAYQRGEWEQAAAAFREALEYASGNAAIQTNLQNAEAQLAEAEAARQLQASRLTATRESVEGILGRLTAGLETPSASTDAVPLEGGALNFDGRSTAVVSSPPPPAPGAPPTGGAFMDASVVDLRDAKTLVVDPAKVKGEPPGGLEFMGADDLRDVHVLGPTAAAPSAAIAAPTPSRKVEILLDALDHGQGNWEASFQYLQAQLADAPDDPAVRGAFADALYAYYLDVGSGGTPEGNPLGRPREPEPTTRELVRELERLGFTDEEARHTAAQLKADSAELDLSAQLEAQAAAEEDAAQPQEPGAADASFNTAVYLAATLAAQGDTDASLVILNAVRQATRDDPDRQAQLAYIVAGLESLQQDADEHRAH